jgi:hypothetical protein
MNSYQNKSKRSGKKIADTQDKEDGVVRAVDDAEQDQGGVVSCTLTYDALYEFIFYLNSFIILICM